MARVIQKIPAVPNVAYTDAAAKQVANKIQWIKTTYPFYSQIALDSNVPEEILLGFSFIESSGDANANSGVAYGLMQITPVTANSALIKENTMGWLSSAEKTRFKRLLGTEKFNNIMACKYTWMSPKGGGFTITDCLNPELNVATGAIILGQYIDTTLEGGSMRLDKCIYLYNKIIR